MENQILKIISGVIEKLSENPAETILLLYQMDQSLPGTMKLILSKVEEVQPGSLEETFKTLSQAQDETSLAAAKALQEVFSNDDVLELAVALKAAYGAKLRYLKKLQGICPEGYYKAYFKAGGRICSKCVKSVLNPLVKENKLDDFKCGGTAVVKKFKKARAEKCGGKVKKGLEGLSAEYEMDGKNKKNKNNINKPTKPATKQPTSKNKISGNYPENGNGDLGNGVGYVNARHKFLADKYAKGTQLTKLELLELLNYNKQMPY